MTFNKFTIFLKELFSSSRLRKKFLRFFLGAGLIPLILMGLVGLYIVNQAHRIDVGTLERQLINFKTAEIQKFIGDIVGIFQLRVSYEEYAEIDLSQQQFIADQMLEEQPALDEVSFISVYGKETIKSLRDKSQSKTLADRRQSQEFIVASQGLDYLGSTIYMAEGIIVPIASPVYNQKNQIIAVLAGKINLSVLQGIVSGVKLGNVGYLYIVDQGGTILASSKEVGLIKNVLLQPIVADVLRGEERTGLGSNAVFTSAWGEKVVGSSYLIPKLNWGIVVEWPFDDAQKVVNQMVAQLTQFSLATLALIFIFSSFLALNLIKPISGLREGAKIIGAGDFKHRIEIKTGDEIEDLGQSLNQMAIDLEELEKLREIKIRAEYLAKSLKREQELSQLKNQFINVASHQLNTPLSVINWSLEAIQEPDVTKKAFKEGVRAIDQSRRDILAMTSDLLVLSEIGFSYQKTKSQLTDFKKLITQVIEKYKQSVADKKLGVKFTAKLEDVNADVDSWAIQKVAENLLENAIAYSNDGGKIDINLSGDSQQIIFEIKDNGIGVPENEQSSLFKEFFRAKNATSKKNVGTGLGLFIAKNFIDGHKGEIGFESKENKGSAFYFSVPRKGEAVKTDAN